MTVTIWDGLEQHSDEWYEARCGVLTASQIGKLITSTLKVADNETSRGLVLTLAAERITRHVEHIYPSFDMQRGTDDEPIARDVYAENIAPVTEVGFITREVGGVVVGYSPDGLVGETGLIEIKSRKAKEHLKTILSGKPPAENMAQLMCGLWVTGREWIDYCSFSGGHPFWTVRVYPDAAWFEAIESAAATFEADVLETIATYTKVTAGLPMTERRPEYLEVELKL